MDILSLVFIVIIFKIIIKNIIYIDTKVVLWCGIVRWWMVQ